MGNGEGVRRPLASRDRSQPALRCRASSGGRLHASAARPLRSPASRRLVTCPFRFNPTSQPQPQLIPTMLRWTILFLIIAVIAGIFGFTGIAGTATDIARTLFFVFLVLLIISAIVSAFRGRPPV